MGSVAVMTGVVAGLVLTTRGHAHRAAAGEGMMAAGLAVALAREGMPFRKAHGLVGSLVAESQKSGASLRETAARALAAVSPARGRAPRRPLRSRGSGARQGRAGRHGSRRRPRFARGRASARAGRFLALRG